MDIGISLTMKQHSGAGAGGGDEETPWYLSGGVSASDCVAAYLAKGAADYATSKVNLANPGTYNLTESTRTVGSPIWTSANGWDNSGTWCLETGFTSNQGVFTAIVRYSFVNSTAREVFGASYWTEEYANYYATLFQTRDPETTHYALFSNGSSTDGSNDIYYDTPLPISGVVAIAGNRAYYDGVDLGLDLLGWNSPGDGLTLLLLAIKYDDPDSVVTDLITPGVKIQAASFYNAILTPSQVAAITTAMQAL